MPDHGPELARKLLAFRPAIRIVYMSGYGANTSAEEVDSKAGPSAEAFHR